MEMRKENRKKRKRKGRRTPGVLLLDKRVPTHRGFALGPILTGNDAGRRVRGGRDKGRQGRVARVGWWKWAVGKWRENEMGGDQSKGRGWGGFPAPKEQWEEVSTREKRQEGGKYLPWSLGPPTPIPHSTIDTNYRYITYDVSVVLIAVFTVPIGPAVELCEGGGRGSCGCDI